jgi:hypothetical protein
MDLAYTSALLTDILLKPQVKANAEKHRKKPLS